MSSVSGANAVNGGIARSAQVPAKGSTLSFRASDPISYEDDQLDGPESSSSLYDSYSLASLTSPTFSGGRSPSHEPPREFGKKNGLRQDSQMPPEPFLAHHTDLDAAKEARLPGADSSSNGPSYAQELSDRAEFVRDGGFSGIKVRTNAPKPNTSEPRIEFTLEQDLQAVAAGLTERMVMPVPRRGAAEALLGVARSAQSTAQPKLYTGEGGVVSRPAPRFARTV